MRLPCVASKVVSAECCRISSTTETIRCIAARLDSPPSKQKSKSRKEASRCCCQSVTNPALKTRSISLSSISTGSLRRPASGATESFARAGNDALDAAIHQQISHAVSLHQTVCCQQRPGFLTFGLTMANDVDCLHYPNLPVLDFLLKIIEKIKDKTNPKTSVPTKPPII